MNLAGFGVGASLRAESRFLPMLPIDGLDLGFAQAILSYSVFRAARKDVTFPLFATFRGFLNLFASPILSLFGDRILRSDLRPF
jgi:hypothetical protein